MWSESAVSHDVTRPSFPLYFTLVVERPGTSSASTQKGHFGLKCPHASKVFLSTFPDWGSFALLLASCILRRERDRRARIAASSIWSCMSFRARHEARTFSSPLRSCFAVMDWWPVPRAR